MVLVNAAVPDKKVEKRTKKASTTNSHIAQLPKISANMFWRESMISISQKELFEELNKENTKVDQRNF